MIHTILSVSKEEKKNNLLCHFVNFKKSSYEKSSLCEIPNECQSTLSLEISSSEILLFFLVFTLGVCSGII